LPKLPTELGSGVARAIAEHRASKWPMSPGTMSPVTLRLCQLGGSMDTLMFVLLVSGLGLCLLILLAVWASQVQRSRPEPPPSTPTLSTPRQPLSFGEVVVAVALGLWLFAITAGLVGLTIVVALGRVVLHR
jgi:hypothetical protein